MGKEGKFALGKTNIRKWLQQQEPFTLHQHIKRQFRRRRVWVSDIDYQWDADTASMSNYTKVNNGFGFF